MAMPTTAAEMTKSSLHLMTTAIGSKAVVHGRTPHIPVVRNIAKDSKDTYGVTKSLELSRIINLLEDPLTGTLKERHLSVLKKLLKKCQRGFLLKELADILKILNICAEKSKEQPEYASVLCDLLKICSLPFLKEKASDELTYAPAVKESLSQIGYLMRVPNVDVRHQICDSIKAFYSPVVPKQSLDGLLPAPPAYALGLLEQSGLAQTLVLSMALLDPQPAVKLRVLQTLQVLSGSSDTNCGLILKARGAQKLCVHMNDPDPSGQVLFRSSEILWNLLERGCREEVTSQLSNTDCMTALKEAFLNQLLNGYRHYDLQLRNDLLVITTLIAENPQSPLIESLYAKQLMLFVTYPELKSHNPLVRNLKLSFNNEDFEMKRLLLNLVVVMSKDLSALQLFREARVVLALLLLARPPAGPSEGRGGAGGPRGWTPVQREALQLQALATLASVAPLMLDDYMGCQGNTCLLLLLGWCAEQDACFGHGNGFHGAGGRGSSKQAQMRYCVRLMRSMVSLGDEAINQDLCDQGAISLLLGVLMQMEENRSDEDDGTALEIEADMQIVLSALCENDVHRKELFGCEGVEMTVHFLRMNPDNFYSGLGHNRLVLSTVDCVWSCIVGCYTTEDYFLAKEGVFLLLDVLHASPRSMQSVVLGTLLELCDNPKTLTHVLGWRGGGGGAGGGGGGAGGGAGGGGALSCPALLLRLWRREEAELEVLRDGQGRIADPKRPLMCCCQEGDSGVSLPADQPSAAVMDVSENLRSKIYSVFCKLGFEGLPGLSTEDYVTLSIVHRYLDFKVGEVWEEISRELSLEGVRPVTPDAEALGAVATMAEDVARRVREEQSAVLERRSKDEREEEREAYREISSNWKQRELAARSWEQYVAKTSNYKILKDSKALQQKSIESSRPESKHKDSIFHPTQIPALQTTTFCGRVMTVESTPARLTGGPLADTDLALERVPVRGGALKPRPPQDAERVGAVSAK